jgi:hypothetical protein
VVELFCIVDLTELSIIVALLTFDPSDIGVNISGFLLTLNGNFDSDIILLSGAVTILVSDTPGVPGAVTILVSDTPGVPGAVITLVSDTPGAPGAVTILLSGTL